jgi:CAAX prenyl protease-like protein
MKDMSTEPAESRPGAGVLGHPAIPYVAPFVAFILLLGVNHYVPFEPGYVYALWFSLIFGLILTVSRPVIPFQISNYVGSGLLGVAVFVLWIAPDVLWPSYRQSSLFNNGLLGSPKSSLDPSLKSSLLFIVFRILNSVVNVPVLEELFWRGWLMRWLISTDFRKVPMGAYTAQSFWMVAVLFASEHGSYWDVGLATGVIFNWWMVRTRSLSDCIFCHAVTNGCLAVYVLARDQWQYWL